MHTGRPPHCIKARCSAFFQVPKNARTKAPVRSSRPQKPHTGFPTAHKCVLPGPQNAHRSPTLVFRVRFPDPEKRTAVLCGPHPGAAASCPSRSRSAARAACSGSLAMMHQANASRPQLRAKRCNLIMPFRTYGLRTHDFSTYESYVRTSVPMQLRSRTGCAAAQLTSHLLLYSSWAQSRLECFEIKRKRILSADHPRIVSRNLHLQVIHVAGSPAFRISFRFADLLI